MGRHLGVDETALSNGELYTVITNKAKKGKKGALVAMFQGTSAASITPLIRDLFSLLLCQQIKEVALYMAASMNLVVKSCFPCSRRVADRFHMQKLAYEAVQSIRIKHSWGSVRSRR